jgi:hypothetical protein
MTYAIEKILIKKLNNGTENFTCPFQLELQTHPLD